MCSIEYFLTSDIEMNLSNIRNINNAVRIAALAAATTATAIIEIYDVHNIDIKTESSVYSTAASWERIGDAFQNYNDC